MARVELQKWILEKCLKENSAPFTQSDAVFQWRGATRVKSKKTGKVYPVDVSIQMQTDKKLEDQLAACLCRDEGIRIEDLKIVEMISPRIKGQVEISGLPANEVKADFLKFMRQLNSIDEA